MKLLGTSYACMVPSKMAFLLSRVESMDQDSIMVLAVPRRSDMVGVEDGFDVISRTLKS